MSAIRPITQADIEAMVASVSCWQVGDYIEPLIDGWRTTLRVTERIEKPNPPFGIFVAYNAVDRHGVTHYVMRADHPRASNEQSFSAEEGAMTPPLLGAKS